MVQTHLFLIVFYKIHISRNDVVIFFIPKRSVSFVIVMGSGSVTLYFRRYHETPEYTNNATMIRPTNNHGQIGFLFNLNFCHNNFEVKNIYSITFSFSAIRKTTKEIY
jgi:hypothetical protein